jgi:hypothetical protein
MIDKTTTLVPRNKHGEGWNSTPFHLPLRSSGKHALEAGSPRRAVRRTLLFVRDGGLSRGARRAPHRSKLSLLAVSVACKSPLPSRFWRAEFPADSQELLFSMDWTYATRMRTTINHVVIHRLVTPGKLKSRLNSRSSAPREMNRKYSPKFCLLSLRRKCHSGGALRKNVLSLGLSARQPSIMGVSVSAATIRNSQHTAAFWLAALLM